MTPIQTLLLAAALWMPADLAIAQGANRPAAAPATSAPATSAPATSTPAARSTEPERTTAAFGDWVLRCEGRGPDAPATAPARTCELVQAVQDQRGQPIAQFAFGRTARSEPWRLVAILPVNVTFSVTYRIVVDESTPPIAMTLRACGQRGCIADAEPDAAAVTRLRGREIQGRMEFRDATGAEVALPFSTRGFAPALAALERE